MESSLYEIIFKHQARHWFFTSKQFFFDILLGPGLSKGNNNYVLDIGCGTGALLRYLGRFGKVLGMDISPLALSYANRLSEDHSRISVLCAKANEIPLGDNTVDIVCLSDVLSQKYISDDYLVLNECHRILRRGGIIIYSDPAFNVLKGEHDEAAHVNRRFSVGDIRKRFEQKGFQVKRASYTYMSLFPVVFIVGMIKKMVPKKIRAPRADFHGLPFFLDIIIRSVFFCEAQLLRFINFPFGVSIMAIAVKK